MIFIYLLTTLPTNRPFWWIIFSKLLESGRFSWCERGEIPELRWGLPLYDEAWVKGCGLTLHLDAPQCRKVTTTGRQKKLKGLFTINQRSVKWVKWRGEGVIADQTSTCNTTRSIIFKTLHNLKRSGEIMSEFERCYYRSCNCYPSRLLLDSKIYLLKIYFF